MLLAVSVITQKFHAVDYAFIEWLKVACHVVVETKLQKTRGFYI
jgi:hypothetical protein